MTRIGSCTTPQFGQVCADGYSTIFDPPEVGRDGVGERPPSQGQSVGRSMGGFFPTCRRSNSHWKTATSQFDERFVAFPNRLSLAGIVQGCHEISTFCTTEGFELLEARFL